MILNTTNEVKKWLRGLPCAQREMKMKIDFYSDLIKDMKKFGNETAKREAIYTQEIEKLADKIKNLTIDFDKITEVLDPDEKLILTAKYVRRIMWDAIEFHVHYSRRQAIRIHNEAIKKLVGSQVGGE